MLVRSAIRILAYQRLAGVAIVAACGCLLLVGDAAACPSCKAAIASSKAGQGDLVGGFFWSILFMMSMPFVLLGSFSGLMYWQVRKARRAAAAADASTIEGAPDAIRDNEPVGV